MGQMSAEPPLQKEPGGAAHGMSAFGLESARMWRTLAPQTEQFPVVANAMCSGGGDLPPGDPRAGSWCYDAQGTAQLTALITQAAALGFEAVDVSLNMNSTWRSQVGVEFQSAQNVSWFAALVAHARALGLEMGAYDLLRNARAGNPTNTPEVMIGTTPHPDQPHQQVKTPKVMTGSIHHHERPNHLSP
jgi:hypothetical protein